MRVERVRVGREKDREREGYTIYGLELEMRWVDWMVGCMRGTMHRAVSKGIYSEQNIWMMRGCRRAMHVA